MRLIDADELSPDAEWDSYYDGFISYSELQIQNALTVNAVPMSVIEDIKARIDKEYNWLRNIDCSLYDIDIAFSSIRSFINECIREKESEE